MIVVKRVFISLVVVILAMESFLADIYRLPFQWYALAALLCVIASGMHLSVNYSSTVNHVFYEKSLDRLLTTSILIFTYASISFFAAQFITSYDTHPKMRMVYYGALLVSSVSLFIQYRRSVNDLIGLEEE